MNMANKLNETKNENISNRSQGSGRLAFTQCIDRKPIKIKGSKRNCYNPVTNNKRGLTHMDASEGQTER